MFYRLESCPFCKGGSIGFRLCVDQTRLVMMCDECEAIWLDPENMEVSALLSPDSPDFVAPGTNCSVKSPLSRWASREEIERFGWTDYIVGEIRALGEE